MFKRSAITIERQEQLMRLDEQVMEDYKGYFEPNKFWDDCEDQDGEGEQEGEEGEGE